jgi:acetyl/propionyl-CoA carboxylase alpha subunit
VTTNRSFLARILRDPTFAAGQATTALLDEVDLVTGAAPSTRELAAAAALLHRKREQIVQLRSPGLAGWTNAAAQHGTQRLQTVDRTLEIRFTRTDHAIDVEIDGATHVVDVAGGQGLVRVDGEALSVDAWCVSADRIAIRFPHLDLDVRDNLFDPPEAEVVSGSGVITAPMHGTVTASFVEIGVAVAAGQRLLVLEAMKMEQPVLADVAGTVTEIISAGRQVAAGDVLARIEPAASTPDDKEQR